MRVCACPGRGSKIPTSFIHFRSKSKNANIFMLASDGSDERIVADRMAAVTITSAVTMLLLPEDVMRKILSFVEGTDLALVEQTCQLLRAAADESLWRALVVNAPWNQYHCPNGAGCQDGRPCTFTSLGVRSYSVMSSVVMSSRL